MACLPRTSRSIGLLLLGSLLLSSPGETAWAAEAVADWTVLVYLDADNDLEKPMMRNLEDMVAVGGTDRVQIIVLAARSPESQGLYTGVPVGGLADWSTTKLLRVERGRLKELADWGHADMGDGQTLARFLETATHDYPAKRYGLVFGDHGMAWAGVSVTESQDYDALTVDEIATALGTIVPKTGRFELIGFDACLMADLEAAKTLAPHARYLVASEEIEPSDGWDYRALFARLTATPAVDGLGLGRMAVDTYRDYFLKSQVHALQEKARAITLALVDLDKVAAVDQAVMRLGSGADALLARGKHSAWTSLARARNDADEFGRSAAPAAGGVSPGMEVYDLVQISENIKAATTDPAVAAPAQAVIAATRSAVIYDFRGSARPHANGLSVFFPPNRATLAERERNPKKSYDRISWSASAQNRWYPFMSSYTSFPTTAAELRQPKPAIDAPDSSGRMVSPAKHVKVHSQVHGDEVADVSFVLSRSEGEHDIIIGEIPVKPGSDGNLEEEWDGEWFTITDQHLEFIAPITAFEELGEQGKEDMYWAAVPAQLRIAHTKDWIDVTLNFVLDFSEDSEDVGGDFIYAVEFTPHGPREIDIEEGDELRMVYETIDRNGNERLQASAEGVMHLHDLEDLKVERTRVPPGRYKVGFVAEDLAGRVSDNFAEVEVR
jgi:hypothetical protein